MISISKKIHVCPNCETKISFLEDLSGKCDNCDLISYKGNFPHRVVSYKIIKKIKRNFFLFKTYSKEIIPQDDFSKRWLEENNYL